MADLGVPEPAKRPGKENSASASAATTTASNNPGTSASLDQFDLASSILDSPLVGGPLSEVAVEDTNQNSKKKRRNKKQEKGKKKDKEREKGGSAGADQKDSGRRGSLWAGSAFLKSPAPEELPMPSARLLEGAAGCAETSDVATDDIRRMLKIS